MTIDLQDVKQHLNIVGIDDDDLLDRKIAAASAWVAKFIGYALDDEEVFPEGTPEPLNEAVRQLVGHLYENREASLVGVSAELLPLGVYDLMAPYRNWSF